MFKKMLASLGVGSASVETQLHTHTTTPGGTIQGAVYLKGGDVEQTIESLDIVLNTTYVRESDDNKWTETCAMVRQPITSRFQLVPGAQSTIPFTLNVPFETPVTIGHQQVTVYTDLNIAGGVDSSDLDPVQVVPHPTMQRTLDAVQSLGFRMAKVENVYHSRGHRYPFVQEFEFRPLGQLAHRVEEIELVFELGPQQLGVLLEVDRRGRGLGGWLDSITDMNERLMRLHFPHNADQNWIAQQLQSAIQQAAR